MPAENRSGPGDPRSPDPGPGRPERGDDAGRRQGEPAGAGPPPSPPPAPRWPFVVAGGVVLIFTAVVLFIIFAPHSIQRTTDAYVSAHYAMIAPRVSGQVTEVGVDDNQPVRAGQLLVALDARDYLTALRQSEAVLAADRAQIEQARAQVRRQPSQISKAAAEVQAASAKLALSTAEAARYRTLAASGAGTVQQRQQADAQRAQDAASLRSGRADVAAERLQLSAVRADEASASAKVAGDEAAVERAHLNVEYTRVLAPLDGVVDQRSVQVGDFVSPGAAMMIEVPLQGLYVTANYREMALRNMRPGQRARIHVDAYDVWLDGVVDSVAPASGGALSPIPANNASGNFTKIVQRLPVKVRLRPGQRLAGLLRAGLSLEVEVDTRLEDIVGEQRSSPDRVRSGVRGRPADPGAAAPR